jgi:Tol biopolymer transport system component
VTPRRTGLAALLAAVIIAGVFIVGRISNQTSQPRFQRLTFRQGTVWSARFVPEGRSVVYSAAWDRKPVELFSTSPDGPESRSLGFSAYDILALSPSSEMALLLKGGSNLDWGWKWGTLARASLSGGAPREMLKEVQLADWASDGATLAIVRLVGARSRVEFGIGKVLYETPDRIGALRISPKGNLIGFAERPPGLGGSWSVGTLDLQGKKEILSSGWAGEFIDLAWSGSGDEIWFNTRQGGDDSLHAVSLSGRHRLLARTPIPLQLFDVSRDGRVLVGRIHWRSGIFGLPSRESTERDLSWLDASELDDISQDGNTLLITEFGEGGGHSRWSVYLRKTDDSPAVRLGDGQAFALSPDGSRALCLRRTSPPQLILWPTGAGEAISIKNENIADYYWGDWLPDGKRIIFSGAEPGHGPRCYIQEIGGGEARAITPEGITLRVGQRAISPDGEWAVAMDFNEKASLYPISGGEPRPIPGMQPGDVPIRWSVDERSLFVFRKSESVPKIYLVDLATGRNELWKEIIPADRAGIINVWGARVALDDRSYYYSYMRSLSDLYVMDGLK